MSHTSNPLHDVTMCYHDDKCHQHHPILSCHHTSYYSGLQTGVWGVSACADVSMETSCSPIRFVLLLFFFLFLIVIFWQVVLHFCVSARVCVRIVAGQWQLKKRTVFVEEQHGCREEWGSWGRPNGSTPSCTEIKTHNKRVCSPSGPVHVALMEAKAAQSVNDQEPWRSPPERPPCNQGDRWRHHCCGLMEEIKITFNKLWLEWVQEPQKVSLSVKLWQLAETGGTRSGPSIHRLISIFSIWLSLNCDLSPVVLSTRAGVGKLAARMGNTAGGKLRTWCC